jgi:hypothetical protein
MEMMERKRPRPCRALTDEFKADIVERVWRPMSRTGSGLRPIGVRRDPDRTATAALARPGSDNGGQS